MTAKSVLDMGSTSMQYDHNTKAGNEGDIVKHVALIASLHSMSLLHDSDEFKYVDIYSGYAFNPIINKNEWKNGIGKIHKRFQDVKNNHVRLYFEWYLSRPQLIGGVYPGSSLIAVDAITYSKLVPKLTLYDISPKVIDNLKTAYKDTGHKIYSHAAQYSDSEIKDANFVFVDPPGLFSNKKRDYPKPEDLLKFDSKLSNQGILLWLPITISTNTTPPKESKSTGNCISLFRKNGLQVTKVRWAVGGRVVGCFMAYKLNKEVADTLRAAIEDVVSITGWNDKRTTTVEHLDAC